MAKTNTGISRREFLQAAGFSLGAMALTPNLARVLDGNLLVQAAKREGVIKVAWEPVKKLDPAFIQNDSEVSFCNAVYDLLVDVTPTSELVPRLAAEVPTAENGGISKDGLTYTFKLVKAKFHDGKALTAKDVVYTFNRLRDTTIGAATVSLFAAVSDITAKDDQTVVFTLSKTQPDFLFNIADTHAWIVQDGAKDLDTKFNGTGPFKVKSFAPEDRAVFVANEEYWIPDQPKLAGMEHRYFADQNTALEALQGGQIDVVLRMPNARYVALQGNPDLQTINFPTSGHDVLRLRTDKGPGKDPKVQRALKMATNREEINKFVQLGLGATGRDAPIGPYFKEYFDPNSPLPAYDPEGAKKLLAEAGYKDGLKLELHVPNTGGRPDFATSIKDQWAKAGITVDIKVEDESTYYSDTNGWLDVELGITGWAARPTPQQYLDFSLKSDGKWNETKIKDAELDKLIDTAGSSLDKATRVQAYKDIQKLLAERGPLVIPYFFPVVGAANKNFVFEGGFKPFVGRTDFRTVSQKK
jgi:peptide/nickel transport system substrate-binding protein